MKHNIKKALSLILTVSMLMSLCVGLSVTAFADSLTLEYSLSAESLYVSDEDQTIEMTVYSTTEFGASGVGFYADATEPLEVIAVKDNHGVTAGAGDFNQSKGIYGRLTDDMTDEYQTVLGTLVVNVPANTPAGEYTITMWNIQLSYHWSTEIHDTPERVVATFEILDPNAGGDDGDETDPVTYTVTFSAENATVTGEGISENTATVQEGGTLTFTVEAEDGYQVDDVYSNDAKIAVNEDGSYTMTDILCSTTVTVVTSAAASDEPAAPWDGVTTTEPAKDADGTYLIGTGAELAWFRDYVNSATSDDLSTCSANAKLTADIDLGGFEWKPIANYQWPFTGTFDGDYHTIQGLSISENYYYSGLFASVGGSTEADTATIKNLIVQGTVQNNTVASAGVAGYARYAVFENVGNEATVSGDTTTSNSTAGVVARVGNGSVTITACYNKGTINGYSTSYTTGVGGITGYVENGCVAYSVKDSYNLGSVNNTGNGPVAGLVGSVYSNSLNVPVTIDNSYNGAEATVTPSTSSTFYGCTVGYGYTLSIDGTMYYNTSASTKSAGFISSATTNNSTLIAYTDYAELLTALGSSFKSDTTVNASGAPALYWEGESTEEPVEQYVSINGVDVSFSEIQAKIEELNIEEATWSKANGKTVTAKFLSVNELVSADAECGYAFTAAEDGYNPGTIPAAEAYVFFGDDGQLNSAWSGAAGKYWVTGVGTITSVNEHTYADGVCTVCGAEDPDYVAVPSYEMYLVLTDAAGSELEDADGDGVYDVDPGDTFTLTLYVKSSSDQQMTGYDATISPDPLLTLSLVEEYSTVAYNRVGTITWFDFNTDPVSLTANVGYPVAVYNVTVAGAGTDGLAYGAAMNIGLTAGTVTDLNGDQAGIRTAAVSDSAVEITTTYTITWDPDNGDAEETTTVNYGETPAHEGTPTRDGYTFAGWQDAEGNAPGAAAADAEYTAQWEVVTYTITYQDTDGTVLGSDTYTIEDELTLNTTAAKEGQVLTGWTVAADSGSWTAGREIGLDESLSGMYGNVTLTAVWKGEVQFVVEDYAYAFTNGVLLIVAAPDPGTGYGYTYDGDAVFYTEDVNYTSRIADNPYEGVYVYIISADDYDETAEGDARYAAIEAKFAKTEGAVNETILRKGDVINGDGVKYDDITTVNEMVAGRTKWDDAVDVSIRSRLEADVSTDTVDDDVVDRGSIADVAAIIEFWLGN